RKRVAQFGFDLALGLLAFRNERLEAADFSHQFLRPGFVLLRLGLADLLGEGIALFLGLIQSNDDVAPPVIDGEQIGRTHGHALAPGDGSVEGFRVGSDPLDIEHHGLRTEGPPLVADWLVSRSLSMALAGAPQSPGMGDPATPPSAGIRLRM